MNHSYENEQFRSYLVEGHSDSTKLSLFLDLWKYNFSGALYSMYITGKMHDHNHFRPVNPSDDNNITQRPDGLVKGH
jgi:hypothetical protein